jgi:hypothetical protein
MAGKAARVAPVLAVGAKLKTVECPWRDRSGSEMPVSSSRGEKSAMAKTSQKSAELVEAL